MLVAYLVIVDPNSNRGPISVGGGHSFTECNRSVIPITVAESLIDGFKTLPPGGGDLCFDPVFVIQILNGSIVQWAGGACFDCGTYSSTDGCGPPGNTFDQDSIEASRLLARLRLLSTRGDR